MKKDVFISYRRDNGFLMAQVIYDRLEEKGITCFLDLEDLRSGQFDEKILSAIYEAHLFILILPKNALDKCVNEDDWVRKEIIAANNYNKTIIPIMYDGFRWPKKLNEKLPKEIRKLENTNGVSGSIEYLPAMIDRIISYMPDNVKESIRIRSEARIGVPIGTIEFYRYALDNVNDIQSVDMAFHSGPMWRRMSAKADLLLWILKKKIKIRILANTTNIVGGVTKHMAHPLKKYLGHDECLSEWAELADAYPDLVSVRISLVPLLHRIYLVRGINRGFVNV